MDKAAWLFLSNTGYTGEHRQIQFIFYSTGEERWYAPEKAPEKQVLRNRSSYTWVAKLETSQAQCHHQ